MFRKEQVLITGRADQISQYAGRLEVEEKYSEKSNDHFVDSNATEFSILVSKPEIKKREQ